MYIKGYKMERIFEKGNKVLTINIDENPMDPRENENLGHMICVHKRYDLGDSDEKFDMDTISCWDDLEAYLKFQKKAKYILPLYLYDHSGITISTNPFGCRWDSCQVGFIYCTEEDIKAMGMEDKENDIVEALIGEVKEYDAYITGMVYEFTLEDKHVCKCCKAEKYEVIETGGNYYDINIIFEETGFEESDEIEES